jgi:hypothetical protein
MALNFPTAPTVGQVYDQWQWDGAKWVAIVGVLPAGPAGAQGPPGPQGPQGPSRGRIFYYNATNNADIPGYKRMLTAPSQTPRRRLRRYALGSMSISQLLHSLPIPAFQEWWSTRPVLPSGGFTFT